MCYCDVKILPLKQIMDRYITILTEMAVAYAPKVLLALLTLVIGFWLANKVASLLSGMLRSRNTDETIIPFLSSIVSVLLKVMVLISVAGMFGIETTSFVALIGAAGLAIGLALQGSLGHFASGVLLLIFRPYKVGDLVSASGFTGEVESIQVFNTVLKTLDNKRIIIPNGSVTAGPIINISGQGTIRVDMTFEVDGDEDIDRVRKAIQEAADANPGILKNPPVDILIGGHPGGAMRFEVRPWCKSEHYWDVHYYMMENVKRKFVANDIKSPKSTMTVDVKNT
jgi:small conductance mechanosensitive channel